MSECQNVCASCGYETDEDDGPCVKCKSMRVVRISVIIDLFGKNWRDAFK